PTKNRKERTHGMHADYRLYSSLGDTHSSNKRARISLSALRRNYRTLVTAMRKSAPTARPIAVVKADAYGHGAPACVRALCAEGCDFFAVSCIEEALAVRAALRELGSAADVLILGYTAPEHARILAENNLIQTLLSPDFAVRLAKNAKDAQVRVRVHVAVDTGMNRVGYAAHSDAEIGESVAEIAQAANAEALCVEGMFTHFATANGTRSEDETQVRLQLSRYQALKTALEAHGTRIPFHHVCNSAGACRYPEALFDGARLGICLYGGAHAAAEPLPLAPVMRLEADIVHVHPLAAGERVGYGGSYQADRDRTVAVLPIGYADGFLRAYRGATLTLTTASGSYPVPLIGNVCMDQCMIDVTDTDAAVGDTVTLFGNTPDALDALAERAQSIDYESLCLISSRVPRIYE
ncbi:MAG: alanine racemase, partial [Clostridia bacterium]|nr:alanine racemase [Clostridia bacterium]